MGKSAASAPREPVSEGRTLRSRVRFAAARAGAWVCAFALGMLLVMGTSAVSAAGPPIRIGVSESLPFYGPSIMESWRRYLQDHLHRDVVLVTRRSHSEITSLLVQGGLDLAWICPTHYARHHGDLHLVVTPVFQGDTRYRMLFLVPAYSTPEIESLDDLGGKVVAFVEPDTNFGDRLLGAALRAAGHDPDTFFRRTVYTGDHTKVLDAVDAGLAHGGAVINQVWEAFQSEHPAAARRMRVLWRSRGRPLPPLVASAGLDPRVAQELASVMLGMREDPDGERVLGQLGIERYVSSTPGMYLSEAVEGGRLDEPAECPG